MNGRCVRTLSCKGRRIQTGAMAGQGCRCLQDSCHFCTRSTAGDACRVCRSSEYLLDGRCELSCPQHLVSSGLNSFKRRCAEPFSCRSGRLDVVPSVSYGCKCANDDNSAIAPCQACDHRAGEHGQHCTRCNGGAFLHYNRCRPDCDGLEGMIAYAPGNFGRQCRPPFTCAARVDESGDSCQCPRSVGRDSCLICGYGTLGVTCRRCGNNKVLRRGVCVAACREGELAVDTGPDGMVCVPSR